MPCCAGSTKDPAGPERIRVPPALSSSSSSLHQGASASSGRLGGAVAALRGSKSAELKGGGGGGPARLASSLSQIAEASGEGLQWLNLFMKTLWPHVNKAVYKLLKDQIEPTLQKELPAPLNGIKITSFSLGNDAPVLGPVHAYRKDKQDVKGFEIDIFMSWRPTVDISFRLLKMKLGLKALVIEGTLSLVFRPLMDTLPVVGGIQIFMINPPVVDIDFTGAANLIDMPILAGTIRSIISSAISDALVLPNRIFIPIADETEIDMTRLSFPRPEAVLRLQLHRAHNLFAKDFSFFGHATSDPYAIAKIGARTFRSRTVPATLNPVWDDSDPKNPGYTKHPPAVYDFFMFNKRQFLNLELFDHDISKDDKLGNVKLQVGELAIQGGREVAIPLTQDDGDVKGGDVAVSVKTMKMIPIKTIADVPSIRWMVPADALKSPVKQSKSKGSVAPKRNLHNVMLLQCRLASVRGIPKKFERDKVNVQFSIPSEDPKDLKRSGGGQQKEVSALVGDAVPHAMQAMIENLSLGTDKVRRLTVAELAHFAHYPPEVIAEILKRRPSFDCVFNYGCHFLVTDPMKADVKIEVFANNKKAPYAEGKISLAEILAPEYNGVVTLRKKKPDIAPQGVAALGLNTVASAARFGFKGMRTVGGGVHKLAAMIPFSPLSRSGKQNPEAADDAEPGGSPGAASSVAGGAISSSTPGAARHSVVEGGSPAITPAAGASPGAASSVDGEKKAEDHREHSTTILAEEWDDRLAVELRLEFGLFGLEQITDEEEITQFYNEVDESDTDSSETGANHGRVGFLGNLFFSAGGLLRNKAKNKRAVANEHGGARPEGESGGGAVAGADAGGQNGKSSRAGSKGGVSVVSMQSVMSNAGDTSVSPYVSPTSQAASTRAG